MTRDEIFEKVKQLACDVAQRSGKQLDIAQVKWESHFLTDLNFSSIAILELIMAIEDAFDLDEIPEQDIDKVQTVEKAVAYLEETL